MMMENHFAMVCGYSSNLNPVAVHALETEPGAAKAQITAVSWWMIYKPGWRMGSITSSTKMQIRTDAGIMGTGSGVVVRQREQRPATML